jgi:streptomycin 6-kinase
LRRRYGTAIDAWLDGLPDVLRELAARWGIECGELIQRGSMSVVVRCGHAVLKVGPDPSRIAREAAALSGWDTPHVPRVLAVDERVGALLLEAIEPGTPLAASPGMDRIAELLAALQRAPDPAYPPVAEHIEHLFASSRRLYELQPGLVQLVPLELYERSRALALQLAAEPAPAVLLHGDLTPVNVLDGGSGRGLVAIDPSACVGDPAFDAVDLVVFEAEDVEAIEARAEALRSRRILDWCIAFAPMAALERAERGDDPEPFLTLARRV